MKQGGKGNLNYSKIIFMGRAIHEFKIPLQNIYSLYLDLYCISFEIYELKGP